MHLVKELESLSKAGNIPEYFGSKRMLDKLLDDYVLSGELVNGTLTVGGSGLSWIMLTHKFEFVPDDKIEKIICRFIARKAEVTVRDATSDDCTRDRICWGIVGL